VAPANPLASRRWWRQPTHSLPVAGASQSIRFRHWFAGQPTRFPPTSTSQPTRFPSLVPINPLASRSASGTAGVWRAGCKHHVPVGQALRLGCMVARPGAMDVWGRLCTLWQGGHRPVLVMVLLFTCLHLLRSVAGPDSYVTLVTLAALVTYITLAARSHPLPTSASSWSLRHASLFNLIQPVKMSFIIFQLSLSFAGVTLCLER